MATPPSPAAAAPGGTRGRILFLHGYYQNGDEFRKRTGALRKSLGGAEVVCATAPHSITSPSGSEELDGSAETRAGRQDPLGPRTWFFARETTAGPAGAPGRIVYDGWDQTLEYLGALFKQHGHFDGVLGFSQGATAAAVLTALLSQAPELQPACFRDDAGGVAKSVQPPFKFAVLVSGFYPRDPRLQQILNGERPSSSVPPTPTLIVLGTGDALIPPEMTEELAAVKYFTDPGTTVQWIRHGGGHFVPGDAHSRRAMVSFIDKYLTSPPALPVSL